MITGRIPKELKVIIRAERKHKVTVDGKEYNTAVKPSFAVDAASEKMVETARRWGKNERHVTPQTKFTEVSVPNESFTDLLLIDLEKRCEGGCAYKVLDLNGRFYDLREGIFLECLYAGEIEKRATGVYLTGEFIWAVNGSQMKIVRVGSKLYEDIKMAGERRAMVVLKRKELKPGYVYRTKSREDVAYLGWAKGKGMLLVDMSWDKKLPLQKRFDEMVKQVHTYHVRYSKSSSFVEEIGPIKIPDGIFERVDKVIEQAQKEALLQGHRRSW